MLVSLATLVIISGKFYIFKIEIIIPFELNKSILFKSDIKLYCQARSHRRRMKKALMRGLEMMQCVQLPSVYDPWLMRSAGCSVTSASNGSTYCVLNSPQRVCRR